MTIPRVATGKCRKLVQNREVFKTSGAVYSEYKGERYVVYSYGEHFPMFIYDPVDGWFQNSDRFSKTTSKQHGQCHPLVETTKLDTTGMKLLASGGDIDTACGVAISS